MASAAAPSLVAEIKGNPSDYYQMEGHPKGLIFVINNNFSGQGKLERTGSEMDVKNLEKTHEKIKRCEIIPRKDLSASEIRSELKLLVDSKRNAAFYAIYIMSHGVSQETGEESLDMVKGNDGNRIDAKEIINMFDVPHLHDIPVLFFFQMCRGKKFDEKNKYLEVQEVEEIDADDSDDEPEDVDLTEPRGETNESESSGDSEEEEEFEEELLEHLLKAFPEGDLIGKEDLEADEFDAEVETAEWEDGVYSTSATNRNSTTSVQEVNVMESGDQQASRKTQNMLVSFSAVHGYVSIRDRNRGTWFIRALCRAFRKYSHNEDVIALMNRVHVVVSEKRPKTKKYRKCKFAARTSHTLKKMLYFLPGL